MFIRTTVSKKERPEIITEYYLNVSHVIRINMVWDTSSGEITFVGLNHEVIDMLYFKNKDKFEECRQSILK